MTGTARTGVWLGVLVCGMFGFAFALVPLYDVFCDLTGLNGKIGDGAIRTGAPTEARREITVQLVANVQGHLPWRFTPISRTVRVTPGRSAAAEFEVTNLAGQAKVGRAVSNLSPGTAAAYLSKIQCFCFDETPLAAGETRRLYVHFVVDPALPDRYHTLTLAYTFVTPLPGVDDAG